MKELLKTALMSQDVNEFYADKLIKTFDEGLPITDEVSNVVIWAITSEDESEDDDHDDYLSRISTNFDYAINQLRLAQQAVENFKK